MRAEIKVKTRDALAALCRRYGVARLELCARRVTHRRRAMKELQIREAEQ